MTVPNNNNIYLSNYLSIYLYTFLSNYLSITCDMAAWSSERMTSLSPSTWQLPSVPFSCEQLSGPFSSELPSLSLSCASSSKIRFFETKEAKFFFNENQKRNQNV